MTVNRCRVVYDPPRQHRQRWKQRGIASAKPVDSDIPYKLELGELGARYVLRRNCIDIENARHWKEMEEEHRQRRRRRRRTDALH